MGATINRELAFLRKAFRFGSAASPAKVKHVPSFPHLPESNPRQGFLSDADYEKLVGTCSRVGLWLRTMLAVGCNFGWRKGEVLKLRVKQIDLASRGIRLEVGTTKNTEGRLVKMPTEVYTLIAACIEGKQADDFVFTRPDGKPVLDFRKTWANVCEQAGVPELKFHDLRRTGARNMRRLGVDQKVIMQIGGWKTPNVFQRYNIVDTADLEDAARRLDEKRNAIHPENRHSLSIVAPLARA